MKTPNAASPTERREPLMAEHRDQPFKLGLCQPNRIMLRMVTGGKELPFVSGCFAIARNFNVHAWVFGASHWVTHE